MSETDILRQIQMEASVQGCRLFRFQSGLFYTRNGTPIIIGFPGVSDLIGFMPGGRVLCVEVKTRYKKLSKEQSTFIDAVNAAGGLAFCARSVDEFIDRIKKT